MYRHHPQVRRAKELVDAGAIGRLHLIRSSFSVRLLNPSDVRMFRELEDFAAAVRGEREPLLGRDDALGQARTISALYGSAETGAAVALS